MSKSDLDHALVAVSDDLDALGEGLANLAGRLEAMQSEIEDTREAVRTVAAKADQILEVLRRVVPRLDRIDEIDEIGGRLGRLEVDFARSRIHAIGDR